MTLACNRPHSDPDYDGIPEFLCRECHPELNQTPESNAKFFAELRERTTRENKIAARDREINSLQTKIDSIQRQATNEIISLTEKIEDLTRDPDTKERVIEEHQKKLDALREYHGFIPDSVRTKIYESHVRKLAKLEAERDAENGDPWE